MTLASGSRVRISYVAEVTQGVTPGSPSMKTFRSTTRNVNAAKNILTSEEVRSDRQTADLRHGFHRVEGGLGFELSRAAYDDFLEAALSGTWAAGATSGAGTFTAVASGNKLTRASGSWVTDGFEPGDMVSVTGFVNAANNGTFRVVSRTATDLVLTDGTLVDEAGTSNEQVDVIGKKLKIGTTLRTFSIERAFLDIVQHQVFKGMAVQAMNLNIRPEAMVGGSFDLVGMSFDALSGTSLGAPSAAPGNSPFSAFDGILYEGGTEIAVVTGVELVLNNNRSIEPVVGSKTSPAVFEGVANITGTMTAFFESAALLNKFINETESSLWLNLDDIDGSNFMNIVIPRLKYTGGGIDPPQSGPVPISLPFTALVETSISNTSLMIQRSNT